MQSSAFVHFTLLSSLYGALYFNMLQSSVQLSKQEHVAIEMQF